MSRNAAAPRTRDATCSVLSCAPLARSKKASASPDRAVEESATSSPPASGIGIARDVDRKTQGPVFRQNAGDDRTAALALRPLDRERHLDPVHERPGGAGDLDVRRAGLEGIKGDLERCAPVGRKQDAPPAPSDRSDTLRTNDQLGVEGSIGAVGHRDRQCEAVADGQEAWRRNAHGERLSRRERGLGGTEPVARVRGNGEDAVAREAVGQLYGHDDTAVPAGDETGDEENRRAEVLARRQRWLRRLPEATSGSTERGDWTPITLRPFGGDFPPFHPTPRARVAVRGQLGGALDLRQRAEERDRAGVVETRMDELVGAVHARERIGKGRARERQHGLVDDRDGHLGVRGRPAP